MATAIVYIVLSKSDGVENLAPLLNVNPTFTPSLPFVSVNGEGNPPQLTVPGGASWFMGVQQGTIITVSVPGFASTTVETFAPGVPFVGTDPETPIQAGLLPAAWINTLGRLEVFAWGPDGNLGHIWQNAVNGGPTQNDWSGWSDLGPAVLGDSPTVFGNADGRLEVFAIGPDDNLGHMWQTSPNNGWSEWADLGPEIQSTPTVFGNADGRLEVFAMGPDGNLGHMWQTSPNNGWSEWNDLGPGIETTGLNGPAVFQNADGRLEVFAIGPDGNLGHMWQTSPNNGWSGWADLGPEIQSTPAVFQNADGRLEVFAIGPDGKLGHMWQTSPNNGWSGWVNLGPAIQWGPAVFQNADGRLEVFAVGPDGNLGHMWQTSPNNGWSGWADLGPAIAANPVVFGNGNPLFHSSGPA